MAWACGDVLYSGMLASREVRRSRKIYSLVAYDESHPTIAVTVDIDQYMYLSLGSHLTTRVLAKNGGYYLMDKLLKMCMSSKLHGSSDTVERAPSHDRVARHTFVVGSIAQSFVQCATGWLAKLPRSQKRTVRNSVGTIPRAWTSGVPQIDRSFEATYSNGMKSAGRVSDMYKAKSGSVTYVMPRLFLLFRTRHSCACIFFAFSHATSINT